MAPSILMFNNHEEGSIAHCLLYGKRLGMRIYFAAADFRDVFNLDVSIFKGAIKEAWEIFDDGVANYGHSNEYWLKRNAIGNLDDVFIKDIFWDEFRDTKIDYVLVTRSELLPMIEYIRKNKDIQVLAYSGNPGMNYPDDYPLICSSMTDYHFHKGKKLLIFHEIIPEFSYKPVTDEAKSIVRSHTNNHHLFYSQMLDFESAINERGYQFFIHGGGGRDGAYASTTHAIFLFHYSLAALHLHPADGYGLGLAHIATTGRMILTDFNFYMGKTLWPIVQAWGINVGSDQGYKIARKFLDAVPLLTPERIERQANWVKDFFNYAGDAERVRKFLEAL